MKLTDYLVVGGYLVLMVLVGLIYRNKSQNNSDYIRLGGKGTWWLTGLSVFMQTFSAATFTGNVGQAYLGGWSAMSVTWFAALGLFIQAWLFAPWMRQTRAITPGDAVYLRFGRAVEQVFMYIGTFTSLFWGGFMLLGLAVFVSVLFGVPLWIFILVIGFVIIFYSVSGGSWSVQVTDCLQAFILMPITMAVAGICLWKIGGLQGLFEQIDLKGLTNDFALIKPDGYTYTGGEAGPSKGTINPVFFSASWFALTLVNTVLGAANMTSCYRYLACKDGREASRAALLAGTLLLVGSIIFYIPGLVGRLLYSAQVEAVTGISNIADGAYAVVAMQVLPAGLLGLVLIAMFSATMSSMDSFLTGTAGLITNNIYPPLARKFKWRELSGKSLVRLTQAFTLGLGVWCVALALLLDYFGGGGGVFAIAQTIVIFVAGPVGTPFLLSFFVRRLPSWGPLVGMGCGWIASFTMIVLEKGFGLALPWTTQSIIMTLCTVIPTYLTRFFWHTTKPDFRARVDQFFRQINTPVDFRQEIGKDEDVSQMTTVGGLGIIMGVCMLPLILVGETLEGHLAAAFVSLFVIGVSALLYFWGRRKKGAAGLKEELLEAIHGDPHEGTDGPEQ